MDTSQINVTTSAADVDNTQPAPQTPATPTTAQTDKAMRFIDRAENQVSKVLTELEKLQKLSNKKYYTYSPDQINELFAAIQSAFDEAKATFTSDNKEKKKIFTFSA